ncbi:MAG TPA: hypothetical protein VD790_09960 [Thermoleophilaceae bacterium]|nr:hypothetical protein [Thermoleophilaceae bacterium]
MVDFEKAAEFMRTHARLLDRRRFELLFGDGSTAAALVALAAHGNSAGGYGHGLEPDLRSATSQPGAALHAFEVLAEVGPDAEEQAVGLCEWADSVAFEDGSLPFAFSMDDGAGSAPFWANADESVPSLWMTSAVCGPAHRVADHAPAVAEHPWLQKATDYCLAETAALDERPFPIAFMFVLQFLDASHDRRPEAARELARVGGMLPESGKLPVPGGAEGEELSPLDISPIPDRPLRALFSADVIEADLDRVENGQRDDGGWTVDFDSYSPQAALEWRGYATVSALDVLRSNGRRYL